MTQPRLAPLVVAALVGSLLAARAAEAEPRTELPSDVQRSLALFEQARRLIDAGNCKDAIPKLEESVRFNESVGAHFSLARCAGDPLTAWREYKLAESLALRKRDDRGATARDQAAALEPQLALLQIEVHAEGAPRDLQVLLDGKTLEPAAYRSAPSPERAPPSALAVEPGRHTVEAYAPREDRRWSRSVVAAAGRRETVILELVDPQPPSRAALAKGAEGPPPASSPDAPSSQRTVGFVVAGIGVVALGAGAVFGVLSMRTRATLEESCTDGYPRCDGVADAPALNERGRTQATLATVGLLAGGIALASGVALVLTAPRRAPRTTVVAGPLGVWLAREW